MLVHQKRQAKRRKQIKDGIEENIYGIVFTKPSKSEQEIIPEIIENQSEENFEFEYSNHDMEWMNEEAINSL